MGRGGKVGVILRVEVDGKEYVLLAGAVAGHPGFYHVRVRPVLPVEESRSFEHEGEAHDWLEERMLAVRMSGEK